MFDKKLKRKVESLERQLEYLEGATRSPNNDMSLQAQIWRLQGDVGRILEYLDLVKVEIHKVELQKKGGPDHA